jgi:hypothetical protein
MVPDLNGSYKRSPPPPHYSQHLLYYVDPPEPQSDVSDEDEPNHEANTSIPSVASTTPLSSAKEIIPDFAIIRILFRWLNADGEKIWRNVKIQRAGVPLLTEIKRAGSRSATTLKIALLHLIVAQAEAVRQAAYLFRMIPDQQSVVLLACTGHWCLAGSFLEIKFGTTETMYSPFQ